MPLPSQPIKLNDEFRKALHLRKDERVFRVDRILEMKVEGGAG